MKKKSEGFTMTELMVVVVLIGILSAVTITVSGNEWRRERVNAVASELAGWLQAVRRAAIKGTPCPVTITTGDVTSSSPAFATTTLAACGSSQNVGIASIYGSDTFTIATSGPTAFKFTPRGTVNASGTNVQLTDPLIISISRTGEGPTRCIRISPGLGLITTGSSAGVTSGTCDSFGGGF